MEQSGQGLMRDEVPVERRRKKGFPIPILGSGSKVF